MNRIIIEAAEVAAGRVVLQDGRARHIREILKPAIGAELKIGVVDGMCGSGKVLRCAADAVELAVELQEESPPPWCDLILAMPRPRVFKRLLPQVTAMGAARIWVIGAARVEKCYFGCHWLRPEAYRPLLIEGLAQAGTTRLPAIIVRPHLRAFVRDELPGIAAGATAYLAHPGKARLPANTTPAQRATALAVGPEGGWLDNEIEHFLAAGFQPLSLGSRILRSDTACIALLSLLARHHDPTMLAAN